METVPKMISTKDLSYLSDMFKWNFVLAKKAYNYMEKVIDEDIKKEIENTFNIHQDICKQIINILKGGMYEQ